MSYDIYIGEAKVESNVEDDGEYYSRWVVDAHLEKNAPNFKGDTFTENENHRHPGYSQWAKFCRKNGLYSFFFNEDNGLMRRHPGCFLLKKEHLIFFKDKLNELEKRDKRPAGLDERYIKNEFADIPDGEETTSYDKVRLIWLVWWTEWALKNCKHPAIYNR